MTKYVIFGKKLYKNVRKHIDYFPDQQFMNHFNPDNLNKIFLNPVTALAYHTDAPVPELEFDKKDIIRALDFWINDKVLENEKLLNLHNRLEDFHELELKALIDVRRKVEEMDGKDTIFKKFRRNGGINTGKRLSTDTVEFFYVSKKDIVDIYPKKEQQQQPSSTLGRILTTWSFGRGSWSSITEFDDDIISPRMGGGNHSDGTAIPRIRWVIDDNVADNRIHTFSSETDIMHATGPIRSVPFPGAEEALRTGNLQPTFMEFKDMYIASVNVTAGTTYSMEFEFIGMNGARIFCKLGDRFPTWSTSDGGPHTITMLGRNRILLDGTEHTVLEPVRVSWDRSQGMLTTTTGTPATFEGNDADFVDYYDMHCSLAGNDILSRDNNYVTANLEFRGTLVDISLEVYVTGNEIDQVSSSWGNHTVRIFTHRKDIIEIDGHRIHVINMEITYK